MAIVTRQQSLPDVPVEYAGMWIAWDDSQTQIIASSLPIRRSSEGYLETIPDLVVEVRSPNDTTPEVQAKVADYLKAGVRVVWVVDPGARTVAEYRKDLPPRVYLEDETLTVPDVIPGFQLLVRDTLQE